MLSRWPELVSGERQILFGRGRCREASLVTPPSAAETIASSTSQFTASSALEFTARVQTKRRRKEQTKQVVNEFWQKAACRIAWGAPPQKNPPFPPRFRAPPNTRLAVHTRVNIPNGSWSVQPFWHSSDRHTGTDRPRCVRGDRPHLTDWEFLAYRFKIHKNSRILPIFVFKLVKIRKKSFLHISIRHKTITFLLHTTTSFGFYC